MSMQMPGAGSVLGGDFRIERQLGAGGMGAVYVAEQLSTGRKRAVKLMHPSLVSDTKLRERFEQEARVGARIPSDHVVQVIAAGVDEACGAPFIVMELLEGEDLAATLSRENALSAEDVRAIVEPVCHALGAAHEASVVHRDLKPENIFLMRTQGASRTFDVKLLDFGIAKLTAEARTMATNAVGTPLWMAPEQTDPRARITPSADVWSLGLLVFAMLTGRSYWRAASEQGVSVQALLREILFEPIKPASVRAVELGIERALPADFDKWFVRCVNRDVEARFANASEAFRALVPALGSELVKPAELAALSALGDSSASGIGLGATAVAGLGGAEMAATLPVGNTTGVGVGRTAPEAMAAPKRRGAPLLLGIAGAIVIAALSWQVATKRAESRGNVAVANPVVQQAVAISVVMPAVSVAPAVSASAEESGEAAPTKSAAPRVVAAPKASSTRPFDALAAQRSLDGLASSAKFVCGRHSGPRSFGLSVTFGADGRALSFQASDNGMLAQATVNCAGGIVMGARTSPYDPVGNRLATAATTILLD